jgi:hypothetical protein
MNTDKPTFFVSDILDLSIQTDCFYFQPFETIFGSPSLEEFDNQKLIQIQLKLLDCENEIHSQYPQKDFFRIFTHQGAYWLDREGMNRTAAFFDTRIKNFRKEETQPLWKLTTAEIQTYHEKNLRHLIQTISNDSILLNTINNQANGSQRAFVHQFDECRKKVNQLIQNSEKNEGSPFGRDEVQILFERCRITRTMLERGEIDGSLLGHSPQDLLKVQRYLEDRCLNIDPNFLTNYQVKFQNQIAELVVGEQIQLVRTQEWGRFFDAIGNVPDDYEVFARFINSERRFLDSFSSKRLQELESDIFCRDAVNTVRKHIEEATVLFRKYLPKPTPSLTPLPDLAPAPNLDETIVGAALTDRQIQALLSLPPKSVSDLTDDRNSQELEGLTPDDSQLQRMAFINRKRQILS